MNQFFSFNRFMLVVKKHWADNKKRYSLSILAFFGLLITWFVFAILTGFDDDEVMSRELQTVTYFFALFATGTFYASQYFNDLGSRSKGINFLLVPASTFEKILCSLLYSIVLFFPVYTAIFYVADALMVAVLNALPAGTYAVKPTVVNVFDIIIVPFNKNTTVNFLCFYFSVQAAFLLGSVYFEKFSFIKTIISGFVTVFILFCVFYFFNETLLNDGGYYQGFFTSYLVRTKGEQGLLMQIPAWIGEVLRFLILYGVAPFLWVVTYYRLKEKQV